MVRIYHLDGDEVEVMVRRRRERVEMRVVIMMEEMTRLEEMEEVVNILVSMLQCPPGGVLW